MTAATRRVKSRLLSRTVGSAAAASTTAGFGLVFADVEPDPGREVAPPRCRASVPGFPVSRACPTRPADPDEPVVVLVVDRRNCSPPLAGRIQRTPMTTWGVVRCRRRILCRRRIRRRRAGMPRRTRRRLARRRTLAGIGRCGQRHCRRIGDRHPHAQRDRQRPHATDVLCVFHGGSLRSPAPHQRGGGDH